MAMILLTGAAGRIGTALAPRLRSAGHRLRLLDLVAPSAAADADGVVLASATDEEAVAEAAAGCDLVVHLAAFAAERTWREIVDVNLESTRAVLDAARAAGAAVLLASSVHAVGFVPGDRAGDRVVRTRPDSFYGFSKAAAEALGDLYADRFGMRIVSARIMAFDERPGSVRALAGWCSPDDLTRLVVASLDAPPGHHVVWAVSANTRRTVSLEAGRAIGFEPRDDAEAWAGEVDGEMPPPDEPLGGDFTTRPLGEPW